MDCVCKTYHEEQLQGLLSIIQPLVSLKLEQRRQTYQNVIIALKQNKQTPEQCLKQKVEIFKTDIEKNETEKSYPPTWSNKLLTLVCELHKDICDLITAQEPITNPSNYVGEQYDEEHRNLTATRQQGLVNARIYLAETYLVLLLHMFDVPQKEFEYTTTMKDDYGDRNKREQIEDFYPTEKNFYLHLYTDPGNRRLHYQSDEQNKSLLHQCAFYLLVNDTMHVDDRATKMVNDLVSMKSAHKDKMITHLTNINQALELLKQLNA